MQVQMLNKRGQWVPAIPGPFLGFRKKCDCGEKFWTMDGYRGHYALKHILDPEAPAASERESPLPAISEDPGPLSYRVEALRNQARLRGEPDSVLATLAEAMRALRRLEGPMKTANAALDSIGLSGEDDRG